MEIAEQVGVRIGNERCAVEKLGFGAIALNSGDRRSHITIASEAFGNSVRMQHFSITDIQNTHSDVLSQAAVEPVLLTTESQPSYVIMSVENYEQLINRLAQLEDLVFGQQAQTALSTSQMVGAETFTAELKRLAALDADG